VVHKKDINTTRRNKLKETKNRVLKQVYPRIGRGKGGRVDAWGEKAPRYKLLTPRTNTDKRLGGTEKGIKV